MKQIVLHPDVRARVKGILRQGLTLKGLGRYLPPISREEMECFDAALDQATEEHKRVLIFGGRTYEGALARLWRRIKAIYAESGEVIA